MKKGLGWLLLVVVLAAGAYFLLGNKNKTQTPEAPKQQPLAISKNSEAFNQPFNQLLAAYFSLHDALVDWDTARASQNAMQVAAATVKVPLKELKGDSAIIATAQSFADGIVAESKAIGGENTIEGKRRSFYTLSENLYNLIRTVHYDQAVIYHMTCPMAFNDNEEASWISNSNHIVNPYLGKKHPKYAGGMIGCGNVEDSIDFRQK